MAHLIWVDDIAKVNRRLGINDKAVVTIDMDGSPVKLGGYIGLRILQLLSKDSVSSAPGTPPPPGGTGTPPPPGGSGAGGGSTPTPVPGSAPLGPPSPGAPAPVVNPPKKGATGSGAQDAPLDEATINKVISNMTFENFFGSVERAKRPSFGFIDDKWRWIKSLGGADGDIIKAIDPSSVWPIKDSDGTLIKTFDAADNDPSIADPYKQTALQFCVPSQLIANAKECADDDSLHPLKNMNWPRWAIAFALNQRTTCAAVSGQTQADLMGVLKGKMKQFLSDPSNKYFYICIAEVAATKPGKTPTKRIAVSREDVLKYLGK